MGVDDGGDGGLENDLGLGVDLDHALLDALVVTDHALHAVGLDAEQVGGQQNVLDDVSFLLVEAELLECVHAELVQSLVGPILICHSDFLISQIFIRAQTAHNNSLSLYSFFLRKSIRRIWKNQPNFWAG